MVGKNCIGRPHDPAFQEPYVENPAPPEILSRQIHRILAISGDERWAWSPCPRLGGVWEWFNCAHNLLKDDKIITQYLRRLNL